MFSHINYSLFQALDSPWHVSQRLAKFSATLARREENNEKAAHLTQGLDRELSRKTGVETERRPSEL